MGVRVSARWKLVNMITRELVGWKLVNTITCELIYYLTSPNLVCGSLLTGSQMSSYMGHHSRRELLDPCGQVSCFVFAVVTKCHSLKPES